MEEQCIDLNLVFENANRMLDYYIDGLKKTRERSISRIANLKDRKLMKVNSDGTVSVVYHFATREKYDKYFDAYVFGNW